MFLAGFLLILQDITLNMFGFIKNFLRKRLLKKLPARLDPVFPDIENLGAVAVVYKLEKGEDAVQLMTMVESLALDGAQFKYVAVEVGKCFKESKLREEFVQWCNDNDVVYQGKEHIKWSGATREIPQAEVFKTLHNLLVVLNDNNNFTANYLALNIETKFSVGMKDSSRVRHNLVLDSSNREVTAKEYMETLFQYLRMMSIKDGE